MHQPTTEELLDQCLELYQKEQSFTEVRKMLFELGLDEHRTNHLIRLLDDALIEDEAIKSLERNLLARMVVGFLIIVFGVIIIYFSFEFSYELGNYYYFFYTPILVGAYIFLTAWRLKKKGVQVMEEGTFRFSSKLYTHRTRK
ncbi:MAG: hypothetical protein ACFCUU_02705 [Cyclobacteriaceae bacterium]